LKDIVAFLKQDLGKVVAEDRKSQNELDMVTLAPEAALKVAITFAQTHLEPYMNRDIPKLELSQYATNGMNKAWVNVLLDHPDHAITLSNDEFVEEVLETFKMFSVDLDLD
jgi:hypothetical protein